MKKQIYLIIGYTAVGLGFAGAFLPLLPTTPFLLVAAYCFSKSSPRMRQWLFDNRWFGQYLCDYENGAGIPSDIKTGAIIVMWSAMIFTAMVLISQPWIQLMLMAIALGVTIHIVNVKTCERER